MKLGASRLKIILSFNFVFLLFNININRQLEISHLRQSIKIKEYKQS